MNIYNCICIYNFFSLYKNKTQFMHMCLYKVRVKGLIWIPLRFGPLWPTIWNAKKLEGHTDLGLYGPFEMQRDQFDVQWTQSMEDSCTEGDDRPYPNFVWFNLIYKSKNLKTINLV